MKLAVLMFILALVVVGCGSPTPASPDAVETVMRDYGSWTHLLQEPRNVSFFLMALCRTQTDQEAAYQQSEHVRYLVQLYVNPAGTSAMRQEGARVFPEGTAIVKEKWAHDDRFAKLANAIQPAGLGIMLKAKNGWTYAYVDEKGSITRDQKQLEHCRTCHEGNQARDSVFYPAVLSE